MYSPTLASLDGSEATASAPSRPISFSQASRPNGLNRTKGFTMLALMIVAPVLVNLAEQRVVLGDSAPRAFIFDWLGRIVDAQQNVIPSARVTVSNNSGTSLINVSDITLSSATQNFAVSSSRK